MEAVIGIVGVVLNLFLLGIIFSLPGRFREQREHMERQKREITDKLYAMQKTQDELLRLVEALQQNDTAANNRAARSAERLNNSPTKTCAPLGTHVFVALAQIHQRLSSASFLTAEAQRCQCVFLPKGLAKAGVAAIATGVGDIVHAEIGIDKQFGGACHATVF